MRIDQIEFLKKNLERAAFAMHHVKPYANDKEREKNEVKDGISKIQEALSSITSVGEMFFGMLLDDMKVGEDDWAREVAELNGTRREPREDEAWIIPFCIEELKKLNKKLEDYSPSNSEMQKLTIQEVVFRLALEMRVQNNVLIMALKHLMGETEK